MKTQGENDTEIDRTLCNFRNVVSRKTSFPKKLNVRKPHESCSRIRVGEGSPKEEEIKKDKILKNKRWKNIKKRSRKMMKQ